MPSDPAAPKLFRAIDAGMLNKDVCQEMLNQAQSIINTQIGASNNLAANLTTLLGQAITLAIASLGAAALVFPESGGAPWMPVAGAIGFAAAGMGWIVTAFQAASGFQPRAYEIGFTPEELWSDKLVANANSGEAFAFIAMKLQPCIDFNARANAALARKLNFTRICFIYAPVAGVITAAIAALAFYSSRLI